MIQSLRVVQRCTKRVLVLAIRNISFLRALNPGTGFLQAWSMTQTYQWFRAVWMIILIIFFYFLSALNWSGWIIVGPSQMEYSTLLKYICV